MSSSETSLSCGVIGSDAGSEFHLETLRLRPRTRVVVAADFLSETARIDLQSRGVECVLADALLRRTDLALLFVGQSAEPFNLIQRGLECGHAIVIDEPSLVGERWSELAQTAAALRGRLHLWQPLRSESDFRNAVHVVRRAEIGNLRRIRFEQRQLSPWLLPQWKERSGSSNAVPQEVRIGVLATLGWHALDSLLDLTQASVRRVWARLNHRPIEFGANAGSSFDGQSDVGFFAHIEFANGCDGQLDIDLRSAIPIGPRWLVQGDRGGYQQGRQSLTVDDGELFEEPVELSPVDPLEMLIERVTQLDRHDEESRYKRWSEVERVLVAIRDSAASGSVIEL